MTDFIDGLERDLVAAAQRQTSAAQATTAGATARHGRRRWRGRQGLAVALAGLLVAGTAAAAVVSLNAEPSKPLAGPIKPSAPAARAYAISLLPEFRAGQAGWCSSVRYSTGARSTGSTLGCGPARAAGGNMIASGFGVGGSANVSYAITTARVPAVRFGDRVVATRTDPALPYGWRFAVAIVRVPNIDVGLPVPGKPSPTAQAVRRAVLSALPVALDEAGKPLPSVTPADRAYRGAGSRVVTSAHPARRCAIGRAAGFRLRYARVALGTPRSAPQLEGRAFASCAYSYFHRPGKRGAMTAMVLLDAQHPGRQAADLPHSPGLDGRRLGRGWLAVYGGSTGDRAALLRRLHPRL